MKTKPFNLQAAINGAKLVTRDGREAKFIAYVPEAKAKTSRLLALIEGLVFSFSEKGNYIVIGESKHDLFLAVQTRSINGHEYPEPERAGPEDNTECWLTYPSGEDRLALRLWFINRDERHQQLLKRGLVHLSKENAEQHAIAEILAGGGEV